MVVKDHLVSWLIKYAIIPKILTINSPGFIIEEISRGFSSRNIFLGETPIVNIEHKIPDNAAYLIGKKFGFFYSSTSMLPHLRKVSESEFISFSNFLVKYISTIYSSGITHEIELEKKIFKCKMQNYIVCRKNGKGYIFSEGGIAGIWAWAVEDKSVEAVQPKCQGRGDKECEIIAAPYDVLVEMGYDPVVCRELEEGKITQTYINFNAVRPAKWAKNSLKTLIDAGFFKYKHGQVNYKDERFFLCEASFMYILERELKKVKDGLKVLWDVSFDFGKHIASISGKLHEPCKFVMDFFPALGFGDMLVVRRRDHYQIYVDYFPWLQWHDEIDFTMFRGMLSGVLSGFEGRDIKLELVDKDTSSGYLALYLESK